MNEYTFDLKLFASITFEAKSEEEARQLMAASFMPSVDLGTWPSGARILADAAIDGEPDLVEVVAL